MINKIIGLLLVAIGLLIIKYFPDISEYQKNEMTLAGILVGIVLFLIGMGFLIFG